MNPSALQADLHFDPLIIRDALATLGERSLVQAEFFSLLRSRFVLSAKGHEFVIGQGYLPRLHLH